MLSYFNAQSLFAAVPEPVFDATFTVNNLWILLGALLVFAMHPGFAMLEAGLTRAKNTVNILCKNCAILAIGLLTYALIGFGLMYPGEGWLLPSWIGPFFQGIDPGMKGQTMAYGDYTYYSDFIFQAMFAATAATIVSGAVAERVKLSSFLIFSTVYVGFVYPLIGSWAWGGGWLKELGFYDFAGSTLVHSVGGWAALAAIILLGARKGKFAPDGKAQAIPGHNLPLAALGVFLLWFGWFGFNGASVLSANPAAVSLVFVTTCLAAAAGTVGAMATSWIIQKKPDVTMVLNGSLAGLVAITAGADAFTPSSSVIIGLLGGILVVLSVIAIEKCRLDDPVGAVSVHLVCGIWGTLAVGIFSTNPEHTVLAQLTGIGAVGVASFLSSFAIIYALKKTLGIRVSEKEELQGLDIGEHGMEAYSGFQIFSNQ